MSSFFPPVAARFLATPLKSLRNLPDLKIAAIARSVRPRPCDTTDWLMKLCEPVLLEVVLLII